MKPQGLWLRTPVWFHTLQLLQSRQLLHPPAVVEGWDCLMKVAARKICSPLLLLKNQRMFVHIKLHNFNFLKCNVKAN